MPVLRRSHRRRNGRSARRDHTHRATRLGESQNAAAPSAVRMNDASHSEPEHEGNGFLPGNWQMMAPLVDAVLDALPEQRAQLLNELSAGDTNLRKELERLVLECEREAPLLNVHAAERFDQLLEQPAE